jgi:hypothetical protein
VNILLFLAFTAAALCRFLSSPITSRSAGHMVALLLIAVLGFHYARTDRVFRAWGIVAFLIGWFWMPIVGLIGLWSVARMSRRKREPKAPPGMTPPSSPPESVRPTTAARTGDRGYGPESFALLLRVAEEYKDHETEFGVAFASPQGEHIIPLLVQLRERELAVYVDANPWTPAAEERALRWLGLLRTSNREDLDVVIRGEHPVPERLSFYCGQSPRVLLEVAAVPQVKWVEDPDFGAENAALLRRLAIEYFDLELGEGVAGLEQLDKLIVDVLRPDGHVLPWTVLMLGSFFGESLRHLYGGLWKVGGPKTADVAIEIPGKDGALMEANVFGKVQKLLSNGMEDSTAWMARAIGERLADSSS